MMKLRLDNLIYTTTDVGKIEQLESLGAVVIDDDSKAAKVVNGTVIEENSNLKNLTVSELEALIDEKGIDRSGVTKKADLIALLG